ncbi:hypothetical protein OIU76_015976 [Salix suchowensis]|uniref:EXPRESSED PROTEIN-RELATED n=2 Tax=Salix TaxID=40685 RepID=A0A9Q1A4N0_9ROSI|nr:hypothetical protein OIU76_015976 [Salix suchowensis]KAJ6758083.1 EXPRESSED PROTEIN-RELATED [Salix koriyanagi]
MFSTNFTSLESPSIPYRSLQETNILNSREITMPKNKSSVFAASVVAASATALSVSSSSPGFNSNVKEAGPNKDQQGSASMEKFAPRFDGLRFIETLITAHR